MQTFFDALIYVADKVGFVVGALLVSLGVAFIIGKICDRDDGYAPIGDAEPPPPRVSPFVRRDDET